MAPAIVPAVNFAQRKKLLDNLTRKKRAPNKRQNKSQEKNEERIQSIR